jgi:hypothetical protein
MRNRDAWVQQRCSALLSGVRAVCTAATRFAGVTARAIAEWSTTGALAARVIRLLRRGLFSCEDMVLGHDRDAWVRQRCSAGHRLCAQLRRQIAAAAAQAIAELKSTTGDLAARTICLLRRGLFSCEQMVPGLGCDAWVRQRYSAGHRLCAQLCRQIAAAVAQAIAELSTTGALAARTIRLLCHGLFMCYPAVPMRDRDAWAQQRCSVGRVLCVQLPPDLRCDDAGNC